VIAETTVQQVRADDDVSTSLTKTTAHVATAAVDEPTSLTTSLVRELLAELRQIRQQSMAGGTPYAGVVVVVGTSYKVDPPTVGLGLTLRGQGPNPNG